MVQDAVSLPRTWSDSYERRSVFDEQIWSVPAARHVRLELLVDRGVEAGVLVGLEQRFQARLAATSVVSLPIISQVAKSGVWKSGLMYSHSLKCSRVCGEDRNSPPGPTSFSASNAISSSLKPIPCGLQLELPQQLDVERELLERGA